MTSPPLSEGPSPEERRIDGALSDIMDTCEHQAWPGDCAAAHRVCRDCMRAVLIGLVRSAHLEDARAGCQYCRGGLTPTPNAAAKVGAARWLHMDGKYVAFCTRPEVWDALSLLPPK